MQELLGVVLCGGRSSRMGRDKACLLHPDGTTYVRHAIDRMREVCDQVCVAGRCSTSVDVPVLEDPVAYQGPITGILNALVYADKHTCKAALVTPVDMPQLSSQDLARFVNAWASQHTICVGRESMSGQIQPLVAVYPVALTQSLKSYSEQDRSLVGWISQQSPIKIALSVEACHNVNTPSDRE